MRIKKSFFPLIAAATLFYACSDNSAPTNSEDGIAETTTATTYTCADGTETENANECEASGGVADSTTTTIFVCSDGTRTSNADDCATTVTGNSSNSGTTSTGSTNTTVPTSSQEVIEQIVTDAVTYQEAEGDLKLVFSASGLTVENDGNSCVTVDNEKKIATISCAGNYYLSGTSSNFQVVVAASTEALVYLYLNGLDLTSANDAPFYVQSAEKVFFMLVDGTENKLADASTRTTLWKYSKNGEAKEDSTVATIYAKDDITFKGNGKLTVTGNYNNGIHTTNDLRIKDVPSITVTAKNNALKGKGSVNIEGGVYTLTANEGDGIKSDEGEEEGSVTDNTKGKIVITGGEFTIKAKDDGIQAYNYVLLADSVSTPKITVNSSGKGIVSDNLLYINAGIVNVTSTDDAVHSNMNIYFNGGETTISSGDDGIHADSTLRIKAGSIKITKANEGIEAFYIRAEGGYTSVVASDDAWNAAGGSADGSTASGSQWNGGQGMGGGMSSSKGYIIISGGYHYLYAAGNDIDVLDANGSITQTGGVVILEMGNGNSQGGGSSSRGPGGMGGGSGGCSGGTGGIIDTDESYTFSGGILLGFGTMNETIPTGGNCTSMSFSAGQTIGASDAAFTTSVSGSVVVYAGVNSVSTVASNGMNSVTLANGMTYYYK
jgi:hypothetical protein